jgi:hypothetical protein
MHREANAELPARILVGGLLHQESYSAYYLVPQRHGPEYSPFLRGHAPTGWAPTPNILDADARDLASTISLAAHENRRRKVELVLHSYAGMVFQRMLQMENDPTISEALGWLEGSNVFAFNTATHYVGSESHFGLIGSQLAAGIRHLIATIDNMDAWAHTSELLASRIPMISSALQASHSAWSFQRQQLIGVVASQAAECLRQDLSQPWKGPHDHIRRKQLSRLTTRLENPGWQESALRRMDATMRLDVSQEDFSRIRSHNIRLKLFHGTEDRQLPWAAARMLIDLLGFDAPELPASPGTVFTDPTGLIAFNVIKGNHYFPLNRAQEMAKHLSH